MQRVRLLGEAVGKSLLKSGKKTLFIASGGLSHDPPVPRFEEVGDEIREKLINGRNISMQERLIRQQRVIFAGEQHNLGLSNYRDVNPEFDRKTMNLLAQGELAQFDGWSHEMVVHEGGNSAPEIRVWIAAYAALSVYGKYSNLFEKYWPVKQWMTGFGLAYAGLNND
jgi:2,3-dihydroxyphenylpropionate 1,2-dioxygenase